MSLRRGDGSGDDSVELELNESRNGARNISPLEMEDEDSGIVVRLAITGSVRLRESEPGAVPEDRVREDVLASRELVRSSVKAVYMSRVDEDGLGNEECLVRGSGTGAPCEGVEE